MKTYRVFLGVAAALALPVAGIADVGHGEDNADHPPIEIELRMPKMDSRAGRDLFVNKGCVTCHSVNGVGGEDASPLDAHQMENVMNPFEFAAKMWRMAPAMIYAQEEAFGEQILFSGDELANIIAFLHDDSEQHELTEASLPEEIREKMEHGHGEVPGEEAHKEELGHD